MCFSQLIDILKALLIPTIGLLTIFIAWQQWKTNKRKLELDRYERRLNIYKEIKKIIANMNNSKNMNLNDLLNFRGAVAESDFIFGFQSEIPQYIDEICFHWRELWRLNQEYRDYTQDKPDDYNHQEIVNGIKDHTTWLIKQLDVSKEKFKKYLDISK